jgi:hypothetical protein
MSGRCVACNAVLTSFELTRKGVASGEYLDLCDNCFSEIADDIEVIEREDLRSSTEALEEESEDAKD